MVALALLQVGVHAGKRTIAPLLEAVDLHPVLTRHNVDRLTREQAQGVLHKPVSRKSGLAATLRIIGRDAPEGVV